MMKKIGILAGAAMLCVGAAACSSGGPDVAVEEPSARSVTPGQVEEPGEGTAGELSRGPDGTLGDTDPAANVIDGAGFNIVVTPREQRVLMQAIDPASGQEFQDHLLWDFDEGTFTRHHFVEKRGAAYDYIADITDGSLTRVVDGDGQDAGAPLKKHGRWDAADAETAQLKTAAEQWFADRYGISVEEAASL